MLSLILFSLITYSKILNIHHVTVTKVISGFIFSVFLSYGIFLLRTPMPYVRFFIMVLVMGAFTAIVTGTRFDLALTGIMISLGMSYGFYLIFVSIAAFVIYLFTQSENYFLAVFLSIAMQSMFTALLFSIKRFRKGIPFLQKRGAGAIGLLISGVILLSVTLITNSNTSDEIVWWLLLGVSLCAAGLVFWWRRGITRLYRDRIHQRDRQEYEALLADKDEENQKLRKSNDALAQVIHTDNKLLMAMHGLMKLYYDHSGISPSADLHAESRNIMEHMEALIRERSGVITQSQRVHKSLPPTGDAVVDGVMQYMLGRASDLDIQFDVTVIGAASELTEAGVPDLRFETLCADLIENAIIAASHSEYKRILITMGTNEGFYELNVQDTGIPFETETLLALGTERASTHLDEGGSGLGYMTIFEILREGRASIIITELVPKPYGFTKSVKVRFDGRNQYLVYTYRAEELSSLVKKENRCPVVVNPV